MKLCSSFKFFQILEAKFSFCPMQSTFIEASIEYSWQILQWQIPPSYTHLEQVSRKIEHFFFFGVGRGAAILENTGISLIFCMKVALIKTKNVMLFFSSEKNEIFDLTSRLVLTRLRGYKLGWKSTIFIRFAYQNNQAQKKINTTGLLQDSSLSK